MVIIVTAGEERALWPSPRVRVAGLPGTTIWRQIVRRGAAWKFECEGGVSANGSVHRRVIKGNGAVGLPATKGLLWVMAIGVPDNFCWLLGRQCGGWRSQTAAGGTLHADCVCPYSTVTCCPRGLALQGH